MKHWNEMTDREMIEQAHRLTTWMIEGPEKSQVIDGVTFYYLSVDHHLQPRPFGMKVTVEHSKDGDKWDELFNMIISNMEFEWHLFKSQCRNCEYHFRDEFLDEGL